MTAFFTVPVDDWPKNSDGSSALTLRYVSKFICKCLNHVEICPLIFSIVSLAVAIILPFLIIAFNVNEMINAFRTSKRKLDYHLLYIDSWWKKIWMVIWLMFTDLSSLLRRLSYLYIPYFVHDIIRYIWALTKNLTKVIFGFVQKGISKVLGVLLRLGNINFIKRDVSVDPESQNVTEGIFLSTGEKTKTDGGGKEL